MKQGLRPESRPMSLLRGLGLESLAWSLRRLYCPVSKEALVLEVGSGGNPYYRANVLLDAYDDTRERHWAPLIADRPTVMGFVENLPFRDGAFDFVIASHVLEHSANPARFLAELQRVGRAGYIEVPDAFMERVNPYFDHRLEITIRDGRLMIRKKKAWRVDQELVELYEDRAKTVIAGKTIPHSPFAFHVRYYWQDHIDYIIVNPEEDAAWEAPTIEARRSLPAGPRQSLNRALLAAFRMMFSLRGRNRCLDLRSLLACPACDSNALTEAGELLRCAKCSARYPVRNGIPSMYVSLGSQDAKSREPVDKR